METDNNYIFIKMICNLFNKILFLFTLFILLKTLGFSQSTSISGTVNSYSVVTNVYGCSIDVADPSLFNSGNRVMIIQMKGTVIDTTNTANFGDIINLNDCGNYEFCHVSSVSGNTVFFTAPLQRSYNASGTVQLIKVPQYANATVTAPITCPTWNGSTGGIIVIECSGTLTLNDSIDAKGKGFILGSVSPTGYNCPGSFDYFFPSTSYFGGEKGEGISLLNPSKNNGMGKRANGGGGGNNVNAGGGGGANFGAGGNGGGSWEGCPVLDIGGRGGQALPYNNVLNKIFLAGGGGGGQQNNLQATPGTNGGGIVIIRASSINGNGQTINASAFNVLTGGADGTGGAGAGGTILLDVDSFNGTLKINAKGGDGAFPLAYDQGASGGGGGGCIWSKTTLPTNVLFNVDKGNRGVHGTFSQDGMPGDTISGLSIIGTPFTITPLPITVSADDSICEGFASSLNVSPNGVGYSYLWTPATGLNSTSIYNPSATPSSDTNYSVTLVDPNGCKTIDSVAITVFLNPSANFGNTTVCEGNSTLFSDSSISTSGTINSWFWNYGDGQQLNSTSSSTHPYLNCGQYTAKLTVSNSNGCSDSISKNVIVHCVPQPNAGENDSICFFESYTLQASPNLVAYSYTWSSEFSNAFSSIYNPTISPSATTTYTVTLTDTNSCSAIDSVTIFVDAQIILNKQISNATCYDSCNGQINIFANGGTSPYAYTWTNTCTDAICGDLCDGNYSVTVTDAWGCAATADTNITEPPALQAFISSFNATSCANNCDGNSIITAFGGTPNNDYNYSWNTIPEQTTANANNLCAGNYICFVTDANGCITNDTVTISSPSSITLTTSTTPTDCIGNTGTATVNPTGGTPGYTYNWNTNDTNQTAMSLAANTYTVIVTDNNGCTQSEVATISTVIGPTVTVTTSNNNIIFGSSTLLTASGANDYLWNPTTTLNCDTCSTTEAKPKETTTYCVSVVDTNGCADTACVTIEVDYLCDLSVPNAFSPNNDGHNDLFLISGWEKCVTEFSIRIYNRWGEKVFESDNLTKPWDGKYKTGEEALGGNQKINSAVFVYYIEATLISGENITKQGNISVIR
jgi:gliding motility-associated-like protein